MTDDHALLIGGTRGLGLATGRLFAARGVRVSAIARRLPENPAAAESSMRFWRADLLNGAEVGQVVAEILGEHGRFTRVVFFQRYRGDPPDWNAEIEISLTAVRRLIDLLVTDHDLRDCAMVLVSSVNAHLVSDHVPLAYHVAKAGLVQMARYYAVTLGSRGIRVNSISPGTFLKDETRHVILDDPARRSFHERLTPLGRLGTAEEVARVIAFLSGPDAAFITGQDLVVDGGASLRYAESIPIPTAGK